MSPEKGKLYRRRKPCFRGLVLLLLFASLTFTACSPAAPAASSSAIARRTAAQSAAAPAARLAAALLTPAPAGAGRLIPYQSPTAQASAGTEMAVPSTAAPPSTPTPLPSPTPTLRSHVVKKGEDLGGIAWQYRVSVEDLLAANPTVQPNMMSIGTKLIIPPSKTQMPPGTDGVGQIAGATPPTPTPRPVAAGKLNCTPVGDGGVWCFLPVKNDGSTTLEGLSAVFHIADRQAQAIVSQSAFPPLDTLPPGVTLPLAAYFPPDQIVRLTQPYQYSGEILTVLSSADDGRYIPVRVENQQVTLAENGLSASISADVVLISTGKAGRVWVAAVAYDAQGNVTGVRRWEKTDARALEYGQALAITMSVYSVSARIDKVDLVAEARP